MRRINTFTLIENTLIICGDIVQLCRLAYIVTQDWIDSRLTKEGWWERSSYEFQCSKLMQCTPYRLLHSSAGRVLRIYTQMRVLQSRVGEEAVSIP